MGSAAVIGGRMLTGAGSVGLGLKSRLPNYSRIGTLSPLGH